MWKILSSPRSRTAPVWAPRLNGVAPPRWRRRPSRAFASKLNDALPGLSLRLPSEAQWEYACRAGTDTPYRFGKRVSKRRVRYGLPYEAGPAEAGSLPPNPWGMHEMHGNVWEGCEDDWQDNYDGAPTDGSARPAGRTAGRVVRGGSRGNDARYVRAAIRGGLDPSFRNDSLGFRCARVPSEQSAGGTTAPGDPARGAQRGAPRRVT